MNIRNLIELLPPIFKSNDTYKVDGKGFLERYLEICGNYLTDIITPDIDNILDLIYIDSTPKEYLNYLWEFLGEIPFANIYNIDSNKWALYYDGTHDKEGLWLEPNGKPIQLKDKTARDIIKYSLSLYKIRGTREFFEVILTLYGLEYKTTSNLPPSYNEMKPYLDVDRLDHTHLDVYYECGQCGTIDLDLDDSKHQLVFADKDGVIIMGSDEHILTGRILYTDPSFDDENRGELEYFDLKQLVTAYNNYHGQIDFSNTKDLPADVKMFVALRRAFDTFFDRFIPYNAKITIKYDGIPVDDGIKFDVVYDDPDHSILSDTQHQVLLRVLRSSKWPVSDNRYQVSRDGFNWSGNFHDGDFHTVTSPGTYYFRLASSSEVIPVTVGISNVVKNVSLSIKYGNIIFLDDLDTMNIIAPVAKYGNTDINATVVFPDGKEYILRPNKSAGITEPGKYKVYVTDYPTVHTTVYVYKTPLSGDTGVGIINIPYGLQVKFRAGAMGGTSTIGGPDEYLLESSPVGYIPVVREDYVDDEGDDNYRSYLNGEILDIKAWLIDPDDPTKVLWDNEFLNSDKFISLAYRFYDPMLDKYEDYQFYKDNYQQQVLNLGGLSETNPICLTKEEAIKWLHELGDFDERGQFHMSVLLTLYQPHIMRYYDPVMVDQSVSNQPHLMYYHNPLFINMCRFSGSDSYYLDSSFDDSGNNLTIVNNSPETQDIILIGAILIDNRWPLVMPVWRAGSPNPSFTYPWYTATATLASQGSKTFDISSIKFKDDTGNTIRRALVAMGRTNVELYDTGMFIQDTTEKTDSGLTIEVLENKSNLVVIDGPFDVVTKAGTIVKVHKVYNFKLNNSKGIDYIRFRLKVLINGVYYNGNDMVVDDNGNTYNTNQDYILDQIRYYSDFGEDDEVAVNGGGYLLTVSGVASEEEGLFNILINLYVDPDAPDYDNLTMDVDPQKFHVASNGIKAISNVIATRPYNLGNDLNIVLPSGRVEYTPVDIVIDDLSELGSDRQKSYTITAKTNEEGVDKVEKVLTVYKNLTKFN